MFSSPPGGTLIAGFEAMALECVKRVRAAQSPASKSAAPGSRASHLSSLVSVLGTFFVVVVAVSMLKILQEEKEMKAKRGF